MKKITVLTCLVPIVLALSSVSSYGEGFITSSNLFKSKDSHVQNGYKNSGKIFTTGHGYIYGAEEVLQLRKGDCVASVATVKNGESRGGDLMRSQMVIRDHNSNQVLSVPSETWNSNHFNNPSNLKHLMKIRYCIGSDRLVRIEHRIEVLVSGLVYYRTLSVGGPNIDVHISNGKATTLSKSFGKVGTVQVAAMLGNGKPATAIEGWRRSYKGKSAEQIFDTMAVFKVEGWYAWDSKLRADNPSNMPTLFVVKENLSNDWTKILNDVKTVSGYLKKAWDYTSYVLITLD